MLGETEQDKYGNNLNELLARFHLHLANDTVQDYEHHLRAPTWILAALGAGERGSRGDVLARVDSVCLYRATTIASENGARVLARTHRTASTPDAPVIAATDHGAGRVVVLADSDLFGDDCLDELDHRALWLNLCYWAARRPSAAPAARRGAGPGVAAVCARRRTRSRCSRLPTARWPRSREGAAVHVDAIREAIGELAPRFPHQREYLTAVDGDLRAWADAGFGKPDFTRALEAFRPERHRRDGAEHLAFFPMYKQNASRDTCCEALIVRVPWPDWIAELERTPLSEPEVRARRARRLGTRGYDSECAVLFPETVSVAGGPANNFGAIFCDREAERLRRIGGAAAELLRLNLPPDAAFMLSSPDVSQQAFILWDLIHDRAHSHGDLPFDPFMIRQRAPYWMYSLEELRCDLTAYSQAAALEARGRRLRSLRPVRDPARPAAALPDHRRARAQLRRTGRPAPVRLPAPPRPPALDRQPAHDRLADCRRRSGRAARGGVRALPGRDRPLEARALAGGPRSRGRQRRAGERLALGRRRALVRRRRGSPRRTWTTCSTTSSRCRSSTAR